VPPSLAQDCKFSQCACPVCDDINVWLRMFFPDLVKACRSFRCLHAPPLGVGDDVAADGLAHSVPSVLV